MILAFALTLIAHSSTLTAAPGLRFKAPQAIPRSRAASSALQVAPGPQPGAFFSILALTCPQAHAKFKTPVMARKALINLHLEGVCMITKRNTARPGGIRDALLQLCEYKSRLIPLQTGGKLPTGPWQNGDIDLSLDEAVTRLADGDNVGVQPGPRVILVDCDTEEAHQTFQSALPNLQTLTVKTPRGWHYWIACPEGRTIAELGLEQAAGDTTLGPGVDTRVPGKGYAVGPGSRVQPSAYKGTQPAGPPPWKYKISNDCQIAVVPVEKLICLRKPKGGAQPQLTKADKPAKQTPATVQPLRPEIHIPKGQRDDTAYRLAASLLDDARISESEVVDVMRDVAAKHMLPDGADPFTDKELLKCVKSAIKSADSNRDPHLPPRAGKYHDQSQNEVDDFNRRLEALNIQICRNERERRYEYRMKGGDWQHGDGPMDELHLALPLLSPPRPEVKMKNKIVHFEFPKPSNPSRARHDELVRSAGAKNPRDHWRDSLMALWKKRRKDGEEAAETLHEFDSRWYAVREGYLYASRWGRANTLAGAIKRALWPGCKHDLTTLNIGPMGIGKSSIYPALLGRALFTDGVRFSSIKDPRMAAEQTEGVAVAELSEMAAVRGASIEPTLAELTRRETPRYRPAYGRETISRPYRHVYVGTSNRDDSIPTVGGDNRRLLPVCQDDLAAGVTIYDLEDALRDSKYKEDLLLGALHLVMTGAKDPHKGRFEGSLYEAEYPNLEAEARRLTDDHRYHDPVYEPIIDAWLADMRGASVGQPDGWKFKDLTEWLAREQHMPGNENYPALLRDPKPLQYAMDRIGWKHKTTRRDGKSVKLWVPPIK